MSRLMGAFVLDERRKTVPCDDHADVVGDRYRLGPVLRRSPGCCAHRAYDGLLQRTVSVTLVAGVPDPTAPLSLAPQSWHDRGPEVAELYDAGSDGDRVFLVTQHPDQPTLAETTPPGGLDVRDVRELGTAVATALLPRHQHGAVHGGLGAGTVAWSPRGTSLADFGLLPWLARWGDVPVAPPFPAPEQRTGAPHGPASDVYALGRLLGELAPEHGLRPGLRGLLADMTAESPAARPSLDEVLARLTTVPAAVRPLRAARSTLERHGRRVGLAAAACCLVGLGVGLAAAGTAPAEPGAAGATLATAAPAAAPPFALHLRMPDDASAGPASPSTGSGSADAVDTSHVADAADREPSGGPDGDASSSSHAASTSRGSSGAATTHTAHHASSDRQDPAPAPSKKPSTPSKSSGSNEHRSHGLGAVLGGLAVSSGQGHAEGHDSAKDTSSKDTSAKHDGPKDDDLGAFGL
ncbi:hypothetical protein [Actinomycetospora sp. TBRC 11914]|uniref:hypothetical protein n=1 Tax=Actinomycetospora sp. TBRC 11914 TaxID=2729387 RepID=UPI00145F60AD|nr:hypothetical protein [Actinomycetospora sp. TBRC 11914]NMO92677.1 hypothetical protein [Actinomycetospora sp. TBRC 11914]